MKIKRFESFNYSESDYEIIDYFIDLVDDDLINIRSVSNIMDGVYEEHIKGLIENIRGIKKGNATYAIEKYLVKYLDEFNIQTPQEFFDFNKTYAPFMILSVSPSVSNKKKYSEDWLEDIRNAVERCNESSLNTIIFGIYPLLPYDVMIFFAQTK